VPSDAIWAWSIIVVATACVIIRPFRLPGGEQALREPRRAALGVLHALAGREVAGVADLFTAGEYLPLTVRLDPAMSSPQAVAFARRTSRHLALIIVPRFSAGTVDQGLWPLGADVWGDAVLMLPDASGDLVFSNVFTGEALSASGGRFIPIASLLSRFPVAIATASLP